MIIVKFLAALLCIVLGFIAAVLKSGEVFGIAALLWFVASIAISILEPVLPVRSRS